MKIIFKQAVNGLTHTSTVTDERGYISVDGRSHPIEYQGLDVLNMHLNSVETGLPMRFQANLLYFIGNMDKLAFKLAPTLTEAQYNKGFILQTLKKKHEEYCKSVVKARRRELDATKSEVEKVLARKPHGAYALVGNRRLKTTAILKEYWQKVEALEAKIEALETLPAWAEADQWNAYLEEILPPAEAYWLEKLQQLKAIPDGTYWLTDKPETVDTITVGGITTPCVIQSYGGYIYADTGDAEYMLFESREVAGEKAREHWEDMLKHDKKEFVCMVGEETLLAWAIGDPAGPGTTKVCSVGDWLDLWLSTPEEQWASYDSKEVSVSLSESLEEVHGVFTVGYRHN